MSYRKRNWTDTWHDHPACRWWPVFVGEKRKPGQRTYSEGIQVRAKRPSGERCDECIAKRRRGVPE